MNKHLVQILFRLTVLSLLLAGLSSCGSAPSTPKSESLEIRISATDDVNPDLENRPSPIILHMLELTDLDAFNRADFFTLMQNESAALGADLIKKTEIILTPGSSKTSTLELDHRTAFLGFVAGYRDIDNSSWRVSQQINQGKTDWISVKLDKQQVSISEIHN